jgi:hypothetical protein
VVRYCEQILRYTSHFGPSDAALTTTPLLFWRFQMPHNAQRTCWACIFWSGWFELLRMRGNRMTAVARYLNISVSHAYRCYNKVVQLSYFKSPFPFFTGSETFARRPCGGFAFPDIRNNLRSILTKSCSCSHHQQPCPSTWFLIHSVAHRLPDAGVNTLAQIGPAAGSGDNDRKWFRHRLASQEEQASCACSNEPCKQPDTNGAQRDASNCQVGCWVRADT